MGTQKLQNYLKTYRKQSGLTQREVAFLLGCEDGAQVSRYEKCHRVPPLYTALACEAVFGAPTADLFAGMREAVEREIKKRLEKLGTSLAEEVGTKGRDARLTSRKLKWLTERHGLALPAKSAAQ